MKNTDFFDKIAIRLHQTADGEFNWFLIQQ
jgi:hypothetical protein